MKKLRFHTDFQLNGNSFQSVSELIEYSKFSNPLYLFLQDWFSDNDCIVVNTSGSTGTPKPIELRKEFMVNSAHATGKFFDLSEKTTALCCLPIDFIAGKMMIVRALTLGWYLDIIEPNSEPLKDVETTYDFSAMVPLQALNSISKLHLIDKLIIGGGEVSTTLQEQLQTVSTKAFATYGMTETITHIAVKKLNHLSLQGRMTKQSYYQILHDVTISQDSRNCLVIDAPKISKETIVTNDEVELISETEFEWKGRYDNVINSGGIKLHPEEIEKKLSQVIPQRFFVAGIPDENLGEKLVLIIEGKPTNVILNEENNFTKYETPKQIFFVDKFLETETGKIKRRETLSIIGF